MQEISIRIANLGQVRDYFSRAPQRVVDALTDARNRSSIIVERFAKEEAPVDRGPLRASIRTAFRQFGLTVQPNMDYALDVHEGRKPNEWMEQDEFDHLVDWARRKGLPVYPIVRSIKAKGTKANPFMQRAAERAKPDVIAAFDKAVDRIVEG